MSRRAQPKASDRRSTWLRKRLRFVITSPSKREVRNLPAETEVTFVPMEAVGEYGGLDASRLRRLDDTLDGYTYFRDGDTIVAKITPCFENGKGALAERLQNGIALGTTELHVLRPTPAILPKFLFYVTQSHEFRKLGEAEMLGAGGQKRVPDEFIQNFRAPIPPLDEQDTIVKLLDHRTAQVDALLAKRQRLLELLNEKRLALISSAVTRGIRPGKRQRDIGIEWIGLVPEHWQVIQLRRVTTRLVDYRGKTPEKVKSGIPLITARNIKNGAVNFENSEEFIREDQYTEWMVRGLPEVGDVLVTTEAPLGECAQIENPHVALAQRIILLKADHKQITSAYLKYYFASLSARGELRSRATGSTALGIKASHFRAVLITVPPLEEQCEITTHLDRETKTIDSLAARIASTIPILKEYRAALISAAVTGTLGNPGKQSDSAKGATANVFFKRAVLAAEILHQLHKQSELGQIKLQKVIHLCEHHAQLLEVEGIYVRDAAGPHDNRMMRSIEARLAEANWFKATKRSDGIGTQYVALANEGQHIRYFEAYWSSKKDRIQQVIDLLRPMNSQQAEIVATLYAVWNDLILGSCAVTDEVILREVLTRWHERKTTISHGRWLSALEWMRKKGLVPTGFGKTTKIRTT